MSSIQDPTPQYALTEYDLKIRKIVADMLRQPSELPAEFLGFIGPYIEGQNIQVPKSQVIGISSAEIPTGGILAYGAASAPTGWILCDGSAVSRASQALLFAAIGTTFGVGDGSTTFNVPDLRQRFPLGKAASGTGSTLGGTGGTIDHVHTPGAHTHTVSATSIGVDNNADGSSVTILDLSTAVTSGPSAADTGSANPPFQAVTFIIKAV